MAPDRRQNDEEQGNETHPGRPHPERAPFTKVLNRGASGRVYDQAACGSIDVGHPYGRRGLLRNSYGRRAPRTSAFGRSVNFCASPEKGL